MPRSEILDITEDPLFCKEEWIGKRLVYPKDPLKVNLGLAYYCSTQLEIPLSIKQSHFPRESLTVEAFLNLKLPKVIISLVAVKSLHCFHVRKPNENGSKLIQRSIPSKAWIQAMHAQFNQAVLDGMQSIEDPHYPGSYLPLWSVGFWKEMLVIVEAQNVWRSAVAWLEEESRQASEDSVRQVMNTAHSYTKNLRWNEHTRISGAGTYTTTFTFAIFLSKNAMMATDHMNMMFAHLADRAECEDTTDDFLIIENLRFIFEIEKAKTPKYWDSPSPSFLRRLEERMLHNKLGAMIFPVYVTNTRHWLAFRIDFEHGELTYGDSLSHKGMEAPKEVIKKLQSWLKKRFRKEFSDGGDQLEHGLQDDGISCGVVSANTAAHDIFNDELWTVKRKAIERVQWFTILAKKHMDDVHFMSDYENVTQLSNQMNQLAMDVAPYPLASGFIENKATSETRTSISHLLNPVLVSEDTSFSRSDSAGQNGVDLEPQSNMHVNTDSKSKGDDQPDSEASSCQVSKVQVESDGKEGLRMKGKKRTIAFVTGDTTVGRKVGKESHVTADAGSSFRRMKELRGRSTIYARLQNQRYESEELKVKSANLEAFKVKVTKLDTKAIVIDPKTVRHSKCGKSLKMQTPYHFANFKSHIAKCKGPPKSSKFPGGGMMHIDRVFDQQRTQSHPATSSSVRIPAPCPGLHKSDNAKIEGYLERTGAHGGGGSSVSAIAQDMYGKPFSKLSRKRKKQVILTQMHEWRWRNDHTHEAIFSTQCTKEAFLPERRPQIKNSTSPTPRPQPCGQCQALLQLKNFKNALNVPQPSDENYKYLNKRYRNENLAALYSRCIGLREIFENDNPHPLIVYTKGVLSGKYKGNEMFTGLLHAVIIKCDKEHRGVGMQNFVYDPDIVEFAHIIQTHSTRAYNAIKEFLPLPSIRTLQSKQPRFPIGIHDRTFSAVIQKLDQLEYDGPVALSCDDTKLLASLRPYYDHDRAGYYLMGHVGEPLHLPDPDCFCAVVNEHEVQKATKLRLWCMQVPIPKVPTIVAAATGIPENLNASDLFKYLWEILTGFLQRNIKIASYASDGSNVERAVQQQLQSHATRYHNVSVSHGYDGHAPYAVRIPFFSGQPVAIIQDPKHLLKTLKNNLSSGARFLTFPKGPATYGQLFEMVAAPDSPLYRRDVINSDRQDDNAATRVFSAASLEWVVTHRSEHLGLITYLFVFGELIDAYQNRSISLVARVQLVMRAHFFLEMWEKFLDVSKYSKSRHFVSPQCADIIRTLVQGFLQALIIYRDHSDDCRPFIPWLLSTEVIEHVFGICRQIIKDFTMVDFHLMIPKIFVNLRQAVLSGKYSDGRARASGYSHTYMDVRGMDLQALATYPSDEDINNASKKGFAEAESLFAVMGVPAAALYEQDPTQFHLPGIKTWFKDNDLFDDADTSDDESDVEIDNYQAMLDTVEDIDDDLKPAQEQRLQDLRCAAIALSIDDRIKLASLHSADDSDVDEAFAEDAGNIKEILCNAQSINTHRLPAIQDHSSHNPFSGIDPSDVNFSELVKIRFQHQTKQALTGVRTSTTSALSHGVKELTERQHLLREFSRIIHEQGEKGIGTGLARNARWTAPRKPAPGGREGIVDGAGATEISGNAANAAAVASTAAKRSLTRRIAIVKKFQLPGVLGDARINALCPLRINSEVVSFQYGIIFAPTLNKLVIGKVIILFSKTQAKGSRHNFVTDTSNIMALSNIGVQIFEQNVGTQFRETFQDRGLFTPRFDFIPPAAFLCTLIHSPFHTPGLGLKLSSQDLQVFESFNRVFPDILKAMKALKSKNDDSNHDEIDGESVTLKVLDFGWIYNFWH